MNADRTDRPGNGDAPPPETPVAPTIIESSSAPTILEPRGFAPAVPSASSGFLNLVPGADFREYRLVQPLKVSSAEADLWLIEHRADGRKFVLKLYRYGIHPKTEILAAVRSLRREHIVEIIESGQQDERSFEIQEFISNGSLAEVIRRGPVPEAQARDILAELTDSLAHLHEARVLHRDIKPSNILVRSLAPADLILTDFGISSLSDSALHLTNVSRTAAYCAPEALTGVVARASDWWSVGVIILEALLGRHPLAGLSEQVINFQLVSKGIPLPPELPPSWRSLLQGLLARDYEQRWGAGQIRAWSGGRRDLAGPVDVRGADTGTVAGRKPYRFDHKEFLDPRELAAAFAQNWADGIKHVGWTFLHQWAETELRDEPLSSALREISTDRHLTPDQKLAIAILLLNPELPLIFKSQVVDLNWCQQNVADAVALARSRVPLWLQKLKKEWCVEAWLAQRESRKRAIADCGLPLDPAVIERLLSSSEIQVISAAHEHRRQFAAAREPALEALRQKPELTFTEAAVLLASDHAAWLTAAQKSHWDKLARLKAFGVQLDWPLAERFVAAADWDALRPLWDDCVAQWRQRRRTQLPLSHPQLETILENPAPDYLDALMAVANRLDFVNSLGMRFITVPRLGILFSAWATRLQDYQAFAAETSRAWKPPVFAQTPLHPIVNVSWEDANAFCVWLTAKERTAKRIGYQDEYRLPYDTEWSYAVGLEHEPGNFPVERSGKVRGIYPWGTQWPPPPNVGNIAASVGCDAFANTSAVGNFAPNPYGLYDLGTNVSEWCWDWYDPGHQFKTVRGASWFQATADNLLSSVRRFFIPTARSDSLGFRCVLLTRTFGDPPPLPPAPGQVVRKL